MPPILKLSILLVSLLSLLFPAFVRASGVKVTSVQPGYVRVSSSDSTVNTLIVSGNHLNQVTSCKIVPVTSLSASTSGANCAADHAFIQGTGQLEVSVTLPKNWPIGNLLLTLNDANNKPLAVTNVLATTTDPQASPQPSPAPSGGTQANSPFAACINANATSSAVLNPPPGSNPPNVNCASSLLTESEVSDNFGQHVGHTYYAIQVRVANQNSNFDFLLRDILLTLPDGRVVSGRIRRFAQGVAVKGKSLDRRAAFYNSLQAGTGLYGGLAIFASTGFKTVGNVLQGSFLAGFAQIFPDYTADNVNRFNTAVFDDQNPSIVPKDSIGQPPLYVVALVPKLPDMRSDPHYGEHIAVSVEGTYIKQVSLVSLSTSNLDFGSEYISPDVIGNLLSTTPSSGLAALRAAGTERSFTISNNNSSPMNISKVSIDTVVASTATLKSTAQDFEIDNSKTTCNQATPGTPFNPNNAFTIPAQSFCTIFVRFHPIGVGASQATLNLEGSTLDGPRSVSLIGKSVGLIVNASSVALKSGAAPNSAISSFACSYQGDCTLNLGFVNNNTEADLQIGFVSTDSNGKITATQDGTTLVTSPVACSTVTETQLNPVAQASCTLPLKIGSTPNPSIIAITGPSGTATLKVSYATTQTSIVFSPATPTGTETAVQITGAVKTSGGAAITFPTPGLITWSATGAGIASGTTTMATDGSFAIQPGSLMAGSYSFTTTSSAVPPYAAASQTAVTVSITGAAVITPASASGPLKAGNPPQTTVLTVKTQRSATCTGTVAFAADPADSMTPAQNAKITKGQGNLGLTTTGVTAKQYNGTLAFTPDAGDVCTAMPTVPFTYTVTQ